MRKAIGWVLRGTARKRRDLVDGRLELRAGRAAVVTVREAVKYLSERERGAVWPAGCQIRIELLNEPICRQDRVFCTPTGRCPRRPWEARNRAGILPRPARWRSIFTSARHTPRWGSLPLWMRKASKVRSAARTRLLPGLLTNRDLLRQLLEALLTPPLQPPPHLLASTCEHGPSLVRADPVRKTSRPGLERFAVPPEGDAAAVATVQLGFSRRPPDRSHESSSCGRPSVVSTLRTRGTGASGLYASTSVKTGPALSKAAARCARRPARSLAKSPCRVASSSASAAGARVTPTRAALRTTR